MELGESGDKIRGPLTELVKDLREASGYIYRRDAADTLGLVASVSIEAMKEASAGQDPDVRLAAEKGLNLVRSKLGLPTVNIPDVQVAPQETPRPQELSDEELLDAAIEGSAMEKSGSDGNYTLVVSTTEDRKQRLYVKFGAPDHEGLSQIVVFSLCADDNPKLHKWGLEVNAKLSYGALALRDFGDGKKKLVLMDSLLRNGLTAEALSKSIVTVAKNADWIEKNISPDDTF